MRRILIVVGLLAACAKAQRGQPDNATMQLIQSILPTTRVDILNTDTADERVFALYDANDHEMGIAAFAHGRGYDAQPIRILFAFNPATRRIIGFTVIESKETPGFADQIMTRAFTDRYRDQPAPLKIDLMTGATMTSRAVMDGINLRIRELGEL